MSNDGKCLRTACVMSGLIDRSCRILIVFDQSDIWLLRWSSLFSRASSRPFSKIDLILLKYVWLLTRGYCEVSERNLWNSGANKVNKV